MDHLWKSAGLDLAVVTFKCRQTDYKKGLIEYVTKSETLGRLHKMAGGAISGVLKKSSIYDWLVKQNTDVDSFYKVC